MAEDDQYYDAGDYYDKDDYYDVEDNGYYINYYDYDEIQDGNDFCKVYDTDDFFTAFVQILLALIALFSLFVKRQNEVPRRAFLTWWLDVSKQGVGAVYVHCLNMITASIISHNVRGDVELEDQCAWYAINYFFDTTVGLFLSVVLLQLALGEARRRNIESLMHSGVYDGPDGMTHWWHQLIFWVTILTLCKIILLCLLWLFSPALALLGRFLFSPLEGNNQLELIFVMIILPGILNVFYFWIADGYLKAETEEEAAAGIMTSCCSCCFGTGQPSTAEKSNYKAPDARNEKDAAERGDISPPPEKSEYETSEATAPEVKIEKDEVQQGEIV